MKPKEYIKKYGMSATTVMPKGFIEEFSDEFISGITFLQSKGNFNYERFKICVEQSKQKFDGICNKSTVSKESFNKSWNYFYATTVVKLRDIFFGDYLKQKKENYEKKKKERDSFYSFDEQMYESFYKARLNEFLLSLMQLQAPTSSFEILGLNTSASAQEVNEAYKKLAFIHHPDKGGDEDKFKEILLAKNKCIAYAERS